MLGTRCSHPSSGSKKRVSARPPLFLQTSLSSSPRVSPPPPGISGGLTDPLLLLLSCSPTLVQKWAQLHPAPRAPLPVLSHSEVEWEVR